MKETPFLCGGQLGFPNLGKNISDFDWLGSLDDKTYHHLYLMPSGSFIWKETEITYFVAAILNV